MVAPYARYDSACHSPYQAGSFVGRVRFDDLVHAGLKPRESESLLQEGCRSRVPAHRFIVLDRPPLRVHRDPAAVEAAMKAGGHEAGRMPHRGIGRPREQLDEASLIRGLHRENVDERDELCVLRDGGHRGSQSLGGFAAGRVRYLCRSALLSSFPTLVLSRLSTKRMVSGTAYFEIAPRVTCCMMCALMSAGSGGMPARSTTMASGRSPHFASSMPITATSATFGCWPMMASSSREETHSPPVLITSLIRSVTIRYPLRSIFPMSWVCR